VPPANPHALAEALNQLLGDENLRKQFGRQAQQRARTLFSADAMCTRLHAVYADVLAAHGAE